MGQAIRLTGLAKTPEGELDSVKAGDRTVAVARNNGRFHVFDAVCPHAQCLLTDGFIDEGRVVCPCHGSEFDLETGRPKIPPATTPLEMFTVSVNGDDLLVELG